MKHLFLVGALVTALAFPSVADAHPVGWSIHKALCKVSIGKCTDPPPKPGPQTPCPGEVQVGTIETIWDARLGAYVEWICTADGWRRHRIVPAVSLPWEPPNPVPVLDSHRACKSIVCKRIWVKHYFAVRWVFGQPF